MPIDIQEFEAAPETELVHTIGDPGHAAQLLAFLGDHSDEAFTLKELRTENSVPRGSIGAILTRLEDRGFVRHRGEYWAIGDDVPVPDLAGKDADELRRLIEDAPASE
ncbi:helix-turn-helix domain-containing protein [Haloarculaceae archaeon H-GB2-1]|nr:helix-turn-helix domain-containing protein [Haloarculaceae archaeon H-GB1-1]MEA5386992.1 helix-turn-helix domain-containing protein [Haloarculaceae archaeon H-GB11]MEA5408494.1 helix-turn-helix domain-containing protein [Haloarculaceae archaeon H-GB2-1]